MVNNKNLQMLEVVNAALKKVSEKFVFVGGATTALYLRENALETVRPTDDVDCVIELISLIDFYALEKKLRVFGFVNSHQGPICRFTYCGILVDIMPTDPKILGFSNNWYTDGIQNAIEVKLPNKEKIKIFSEAYFLASKLEAFKGRGKNNFRDSSDIEDVVTVLEACPDLWIRLEQASIKVKTYLQNEFKKLLSNDLFIESLSAHLSGGVNRQERADRVEQLLRDFVR